jgi:hypothetical protein
MAARYQLRHPKSAVPLATGLPRTRPSRPRHGVAPLPPVAVRSTVRPPYPQIGESARLWDYVESQWIEGTIESIQPGNRILVRCSGGLEETVGSYLTLREGSWVEGIVGATRTAI